MIGIQVCFEVFNRNVNLASFLLFKVLCYAKKTREVTFHLTAKNLSISITKILFKILKKIDS